MTRIDISVKSVVKNKRLEKATRKAYLEFRKYLRH